MPYVAPRPSGEQLTNIEVSTEQFDTTLPLSLAQLPKCANLWRDKPNAFWKMLRAIPEIEVAPNILRIEPGVLLKISSSTLVREEVACLAFVARMTTIPVPRVLYC